MEKFNQLKALVADLEADANSFYTKGNKAAGTRLRVGMQELKSIAQEVRTEVTEIKNAKEAE